MVRYIKKLQIGKNGLTPEFMAQIKTLFEAEKMLKVVLLKSACRDKKHAKEIANQIVEELGPKYRAKLIGYVMTISKFRKVK